MALVDYSSSDPDSGDEQDHHQPEPRCHPAGAATSASASATATAIATSPQDSDAASASHTLAQPHQPPVSSALPPLPPTFHDLYASTVRTATADLPSLHQGRRRTIPHRDGNWPSHIYLEWHPSPSHHQLLQSLLAALARELGPLLNPHGLAGFLTSELGAPLPLHVSLSRPFVLRTHDKDTFLHHLIRDTARCNVAPFALVCSDLAWHRSPDSERSFLVLRVHGPGGCNDELSALLCTYNRLVASYGQPELYTTGGPRRDGSNLPSDAFHVSIAWSFTAPTPELNQKTAEVFSRPGFRDAILSQIGIPVDGVKVKIGNLVNNVALPESGGKSGNALRRGLF
ncbi:hypothetical protein DHEL01_v210101 [Diaporthe helianthi]|uniref:U6 snRNA phosphodiesterase n=1 Tax=Diaporthe helianthi TaxID=158607 RepID=A0A2P5HML7_DIAHE|nr:hypothetical protein DHEL01_v210101 [Diaporthe helianthi]